VFAQSIIAQPYVMQDQLHLVFVSVRESHGHAHIEAAAKTYRKSGTPGKARK